MSKREKTQQLLKSMNYDILTVMTTANLFMSLSLYFFFHYIYFILPSVVFDLNYTSGNLTSLYYPNLLTLAC